MELDTFPQWVLPFHHTHSNIHSHALTCMHAHTHTHTRPQTDEQEVINFLLTTEIIPLCLQIMESGSELSKTVATFIQQKILLDETRLSYICQTFERFSHVSTVLVSFHPPPLFRALTSPTPFLTTIYLLPRLKWCSHWRRSHPLDC